MEFKGTKGKWVTDYHCTDRQFINISSEEKGIVARSFYGDIEPILNQEECKANALLISKAPEMLEMLEMINECRNDFDRWGEIEQLIKEATEYDTLKNIVVFIKDEAMLEEARRILVENGEVIAEDGTFSIIEGTPSYSYLGKFNRGKWWLGRIEFGVEVNTEITLTELETILKEK